MLSCDSSLNPSPIFTMVYDDAFYDYSDFEPISVNGYSHYGEMPVIRIADTLPVERPTVSRRKL